MVSKKYRFDFGLFVGRFQPFHKGHLHALRFAIKFCKKLVIGVGSSQISNTERNPLTSNKRIAIIKTTLGNEILSKNRLIFAKIPDFSNDEKWFRYIISRWPKTAVVFSRNRVVNRIFKEHGILVISPPWHNRNKFSGTKIRKLIKLRKKWSDRIPEKGLRKVLTYFQRY